MYEKFTTQQFYYTSKQTYFEDKYRVKKWIVASYLYLPDERKLMRFESHFGELITNKEYLEEFDEEDFEDEFFKEHYIYTDEELEKLIEEEQDPRSKESMIRYDKPLNCYKKEDLTWELSKYCPEPEKQKNYFYKRAFHKKEPTSPFYTLRDDLKGYDNGKKYTVWEKLYTINKQNLKEYSDTVRGVIVSYIQEGKIKYNSRDEYIFLILQISSGLEYLLKENNLDWAYKSFKDIDIKIKSLEPFLGNFYSEYFDNLLECITPNPFGKCEYCGQVMYSAKDKKYCSVKKDGQDCAKKARNQRTYERRKNTLLKND